LDKQESATYIALGTPLLVLAVFLVYPVVSVIGNGLLLENITSFIQTIEYNWTYIQFTSLQAILSTIMAVMVGLPGGILLARLRFRGKSLLRALIIVPFVLPPIVVVVGFLQMFGQFGIIDSLLMLWFHSSGSILNLANGIPGILLAHTFYNAPLVILLISASMERLNPEIEEAAELLGANPKQRFWRITLPHIMPSLIAAAILTFLFCFMSFPIVLAFGHGTYRTIEVQVWNAFRWSDYGQASSLVLIQILFTLTLAFAYIRLGKSTRGAAGPTASIKTVPLRSYRSHEIALLILYFGGLLVLVTGPILSIMRSSFYNWRRFKIRHKFSLL
jgi:thiamine transport system permease protein